MAQPLAEDELHEGQAIIVPPAWTDSAMTQLQNRLKETTLGIRRAVADLPPERHLGAVVAEIRRFSTVPAMFHWMGVTQEAIELRTGLPQRRV
eukprot:3458891-Alexandrium_andersonii.AAC.1